MSESLEAGLSSPTPVGKKFHGAELMWFRNGNQICLKPHAPNNVSPILPVGIYTVRASPEGLFLEDTAPFKMPSRFYGSTLDTSTKVLNTFMARRCSTGVLAVGEKGSGKTLLAKTISMLALEAGIPVLIIDMPIPGAMLASFLQLIQQPCVVFMDEFEKVYGSDQNQLLTVLDGVHSTNKLFLMTGNVSASLNFYLLSRPSRIFYYFDYAKLEDKVVEDYVKDNLKNVALQDSTISALSNVAQLNFDCLQALIEEMNRYNINLDKASEHLNVARDLRESSHQLFDLNYFRGGKQVSRKIYEDGLSFIESHNGVVRATPYLRCFEDTKTSTLLSEEDMEKKVQEIKPDWDEDVESLREVSKKLGFEYRNFTFNLDVTTLVEADVSKQIMKFHCAGFDIWLTPAERGNQAFKKKYNMLARKGINAKSIPPILSDKLTPVSNS